MDHSATMQLDMMADDLVTIKSKITYIESNLGVLRSDVISGKESLLDKTNICIIGSRVESKVAGFFVFQI